MNMEKLIEELASSVECFYSENKSVKQIIEEVLADVGIEATTMLRRDHDGVSQADYLIVKMIGEHMYRERISL